MLKIINGEVYDPLNGINGEIKDIYLQDGKIVSRLEEGAVPAKIINARGMVVMPGGVDIHSHIAGPKVNAGRSGRPEDHRGNEYGRSTVTRAGVGKTVPSSFTTGYLYALMGYTTVMEAAVPPLKARHVHEEFNDIPIIDKGFFALMGNNHFVLDFIRRGDKKKLRNYVGWLLAAIKGYAVKAVNPGGVENWKRGLGLRGLDELVEGYEVTPRQIITWLVEANEELGLPHPVHLHCNDIGHAGNYRTTLETMKAVQGQRIHLTHLQFHSYGGDNRKNLCSGVEKIAAYINQNPSVTIDVGQVIFGQTTTMSADSPLQYSLHKLTGNKWINNDVELETGSGVVPMVFKEKNLANSIQWAVGLELFLLIDDPWQVFLTTDHPNGGPFTSYPQVIKLLMDRSYREQILSSLHPKVADRTIIKDLKREYTLPEIAIITRAGPARALGLEQKGHLGAGADADITVYPKENDWEKMFATPVFVLKDGEIVVEQGEVVKETFGRTYFVNPAFDQQILEEIREDFAKFATVSLANYPVDLDYLERYEVISCKSKE
jgi:formylmethanofuran dehydrogenase subunit A